MSGSNIREAMFKVAEWGIRGRLDRARGVVPLTRSCVSCCRGGGS